MAKTQEKTPMKKQPKSKKLSRTKKQPVTKDQPRKNKLITAFYSTGASASSVSTEREKNHIEKFYSLNLNSCQEKGCVDLKAELSKQLAASKLKLAQIEKAQALLKIVCAEKDEEIKNLQQSLIAALPATEKIVETVTLPATEKPFDRFVDEVGVGRLDMIRSIGATISDDSTFVLEIMRTLYADDINELDNITVTGRSKTNSKTKMCERKMGIVSSMFIERLASQPLRNVRLKSLNQLISRAIVNIIKGIKNKNCDNKLMSKINETFKENEK